MIRAFVSLVALLALLTAGQAPAAHHEEDEKSEKADGPAPLPAWNQDDVSSKARELQNTVDRLRQLDRERPPDTLGSGQTSAGERYRKELRTLWAECRGLADEVGKGKTREETANKFNRIQEIYRDVAEQARRMFLSKENIDEIQKAEALLSDLRIYYKGAPEAYPALVGPAKGSDEGASQKK